MEILGIITARGGSKGIPKKNLRKISGVPLIEYTIKAARKSTKIKKLIVSTDNQEIIKHSQKLGVEVPFKRPAKYSKDNSLSIDVISHALQFLKKRENYQPDIVVLLQPTSPLRDPLNIDKSVNLLKKSKSSSVVGVFPMKQYPQKAFLLDKNNFLIPYAKNQNKYSQRQNIPSFFYPSGSLYTFWTKTLLTSGNIYGKKIKPLMVSKEESIDVDEPFDLFLVEMILKHWNSYKKRFSKKSDLIGTIN
jgi:CMP-N-acetylneuraminic acid synthetase